MRVNVIVWVSISAIVIISAISVTVGIYLHNIISYDPCTSPENNQCGCRCGDCPVIDQPYCYNFSGDNSVEAYKIPGVTTPEDCQSFLFDTVNCELGSSASNCACDLKNQECYLVLEENSPLYPPDSTIIIPDTSEGSSDYDCYDDELEYQGEYMVQSVHAGRPYLVSARLEEFYQKYDSFHKKWLEQCLGEHQSIASFSKFSIDLLVIGAPLEFVQGALDAGLDELRHARITCEMAGVSLDFKLPEHQLEFNDDIFALTISVAKEGCIHETISSLKLFDDVEMLRVAGNTSASSLILTIADDEVRHSKLAWDFIYWSATSDKNIKSIVDNKEWWEKLIIEEAEERYYHYLMVKVEHLLRKLSRNNM
eukprot:TRINITY_DN216_c0_g1_i1.p1 TRINITY_DN216_c0_g1~~TRINITY_DN216_c0_g1_i1.p1  ORF type:complete len:367 (-),score=69.38 TRINITY_DN216_c0_g1_i1:22-1122(-)